MSGPWSKLKARVEDLWVPKLGLSIHCTSYHRDDYGVPSPLSRHWITLNKTIVWDFPGPFLGEAPARGRGLGKWARYHPNGGPVIGNLLRDYLDRDRDRLFEPFEDDGWELTDILRAADRRLGREVLATWAEGLDEGHPAHRVLAARFAARRRPIAQDAPSA